MPCVPSLRAVQVTSVVAATAHTTTAPKVASAAINRRKQKTAIELDNEVSGLPSQCRCSLGVASAAVVEVTWLALQNPLPCVVRRPVRALFVDIRERDRVGWVFSLSSTATATSPPLVDHQTHDATVGHDEARQAAEDVRCTADDAADPTKVVAVAFCAAAAVTACDLRVVLYCAVFYGNE